MSEEKRLIGEKVNIEWEDLLQNPGLGNVRPAGHMRPAKHLNVAHEQFSDTLNGHLG